MKKIVAQTIILFCPLLIFVAISSIYFGGGVLNHMTTMRFGSSNDSLSFIWGISWWLHALHHGLNPFFTSDVWFPYRYNLTQQNVIMFGNFLLISPIAYLFGPVVAYNITEIYASALAAWTAFILCRYMTQTFWPSVFGGYFFGYSSYMIGHALGHPILITVFPIPLIVLCCIKLYRKEISTRMFLIFFTILLSFQLITSLETITVFVAFGNIAALLSMWLFKMDKTLGWRWLKNIILGQILTGLVVSPYLYLFFSTPLPPNAFPDALFASSDLLSFIIPSFLMLVQNHWTFNISQQFFGHDPSDWNAYIGVPLLILFFLFAKEFWKYPFGKLLVGLTLFISVASLGYELYVAGQPWFPLPWHFLLNIPLWKHALPTRFGVFTSLALAIVVAYWLTYSQRSLQVKALMLSASILFLMPTFDRSQLPWANSMTVPAFISQNQYQRWLNPQDVVVILPYADQGPAMNWQMQSHFYFKMAGGYLGSQPPSFANDPTVSLFQTFSQTSNLNLGKNIENVNNLEEFLVNHHVSAIWVANNFDTWANFFAHLGLKPIHQGDIDVYFVKPIMSQLQNQMNHRPKMAFESWYDPEFNNNGYARWSPGQSKIVVASNRSVTAELTGNIYVIDPRVVKLYVNQHLVRIFNITHFSPIVHTRFALNKGSNTIEFISTAPPKKVKNDPRQLSFSLRNYSIHMTK